MSTIDKQYIKNLPKKKLITLHRGFGTGIRNKFGLWGDNKALRSDCFRLMKKDYKEDYKRFMNHWKTFGKDYSGENTHPDDASHIIICELWRRLQNKSERL